MYPCWPAPGRGRENVSASPAPLRPAGSTPRWPRFRRTAPGRTRTRGPAGRSGDSRRRPAARCRRPGPVHRDADGGQRAGLVGGAGTEYGRIPLALLDGRGQFREVRPAKGLRLAALLVRGPPPPRGHRWMRGRCAAGRRSRGDEPTQALCCARRGTLRLGHSGKRRRRRRWARRPRAPTIRVCPTRRPNGALATQAAAQVSAPGDDPSAPTTARPASRPASQAASPATRISTRPSHRGSRRPDLCASSKSRPSESTTAGDGRLGHGLRPVPVQRAKIDHDARLGAAGTPRSFRESHQGSWWSSSPWFS